jgi:hypothetical protein
MNTEGIGGQPIGEVKQSYGVEPSTKTDSAANTLRTASYITETTQYAGKISDKINASKDNSSFGLYLRDKKDLETMEIEHNKLVEKTNMTMGNARDSIDILVGDLKEKEDQFRVLPKDQRDQVLRAVRSDLTDFRARIAEDLPVITPVVGGPVTTPVTGEPAGVKPAVQPPGDKVSLGWRGGGSPNDTWSRRDQIMEMIRELVAAIDAMLDGDAPPTGYPLSQIVILHAKAMVEYREAKAMEMADQQEALNNGLHSINEMLRLMRNIQSSAGPDGIRNPADATRMAQAMQKTMLDLFGPMKSEANPNGWYINDQKQLIPGAGSQLDKIMTALWQGGGDPMENPVYRMINGFVGTLNGLPPNADDSSFRPLPTVNFMQAMTNGTLAVAESWIKMMGYNYHQDVTSGPEKGGTDYVGQGTQEWGAIQAAATGMSGQVNMQMQQLLSEVTQLVDTARSILENDSRVMEKIIRNST